MYELANVRCYKFIYKFLEIGRMDVVLHHLKTFITKDQFLSNYEKTQFSDLLLYCYIYRISISTEISQQNEILIEFNKFVENCDSYDYKNAISILLDTGMIEEMFQIWERKSIGSHIIKAIEILTRSEFFDIAFSSIKVLLPLIKKNEGFIYSQYILFNSCFFSSLSIENQIELIIEDISFIKYNIHSIFDNISLSLSEETLRKLINIFDPCGQTFLSLDFDSEEEEQQQQQQQQTNQETPLPNSPISSINQYNNEIYFNIQNKIAKSNDIIELFIKLLLCLSYKLQEKREIKKKNKKQQNNNNLSSSNENLNNKNPKSRLKNNSRRRSSSPLHLSVEDHKKSLSKKNFQEKIETRGASKVSCGGNHIALITVSGELFTWGDNRSGQLGFGFSRKVAFKPMKVKFFKGKHVYKVCCGGDFTLVITKDHRVYSWGKGSSGQLGHGNTDTIDFPQMIDKLSHVNIHQIACGFHHSAVISTDGKLWTFGEGNLGHGTDGVFSSPQCIPDIENAEEVACGWSHTVVRTTQGEVYTWGSGEYGQLGHGNNEDVKIPKLVESLKKKHIQKIGCGYLHTLAILGLYIFFYFHLKFFDILLC